MICGKTNGEGGGFLGYSFLLVPLIIVDMPISIATDTVAFPYDVYFLFEPRGQLHTAIKEHSFEKVKDLLEGGADPNAIFKDDTPLIIACRSANIEFVQILLMYRADVNKEGHCGRSPLSAACERGNTAIFKLLLKHKVDLCSNNYDRVLLLACYSDNMEIVRILLDGQPDAERYRHEPSLFYTQNIEIVRLLIERGADLNSNSFYGRTPLINVVERGRSAPETVDILVLLMKNGADVNLVNDNKTVLDDAKLCESPKAVIDFLREHGAKTAKELEAEKQKKNLKTKGSIQKK